MDKTMKPDLDNYTLEELTSLKKDVEAAINSFNARALAHAREELEKLPNPCANRVRKLPQNIAIQMTRTKLGQGAAANPSGLNTRFRAEKH